MTTAQLTGRIEIGSYRDWSCRKSGAGSRVLNKARASRSLTGVLLAAMDREDNMYDRLAGYGLCGFTMFYLAAHVLRAVF